MPTLDRSRLNQAYKCLDSSCVMLNISDWLKVCDHFSMSWWLVIGVALSTFTFHMKLCYKSSKVSALTEANPMHMMLKPGK